MTIESTLDLKLKLVLTRSFGRVTDQDILEHEQWLAQQVGFEPSFSQLADARGVTENLVTPKGLTTLAQITPFSHSARRCYVVSSQLAMGFCNLFGFRTAEGPECFYITESIDDGLAWIRKSQAK